MMTWKTFFEMATGLNSPMVLMLVLGFFLSSALVLKDPTDSRVEVYLGVGLVTACPLVLVLLEQFGVKVAGTQTQNILVGLVAIFVSPFAVGWIFGWPIGRLLQIIRG